MNWWRQWLCQHVKSILQINIKNYNTLFEVCILLHIGLSVCLPVSPSAHPSVCLSAQRFGIAYKFLCSSELFHLLHILSREKRRSLLVEHVDVISQYNSPTIHTYNKTLNVHSSTRISYPISSNHPPSIQTTISETLGYIPIAYNTVHVFPQSAFRHFFFLLMHGTYCFSTILRLWCSLVSASLPLYHTTNRSTLRSCGWKCSVQFSRGSGLCS